MAWLLSIVNLFICIISIANVGQATSEITLLQLINPSARVVLFVLAFSKGILVFCSNASWNPNATTFADQTVVGSTPTGLFITRKNTIVVPHYDDGNILIWHNGTTGDPTTIIPAGLSNPRGAFVTSDEQIFVDNRATSGQVERWTLNGTRLSSTFFHESRCVGLFVDVNNQLYCSGYDFHQVLRQSLTDPSSGLIIVAGTGDAGSTAEMLSSPFGIFVTFGLDLYVADLGNDRVQLFRPGQRNGTTVAGNGSSGTIDLDRPTGVFVDGDGYLFIVDQYNHRIVGSDSSGFRCLVGCSRVNGAGSSELSFPHTMSFDMDGNLFVMDRGNARIQKFFLMNNSCGKCQSTSSLPFLTPVRWRRWRGDKLISTLLASRLVWENKRENTPSERSDNETNSSEEFLSSFVRRFELVLDRTKSTTTTTKSNTVEAGQLNLLLIKEILFILSDGWNE